MPYKDKEKQREAQRLWAEKNRIKNKHIIRINAQERKRALTKYIREYKESIGCTDCKIEYPFFVLQFDHVRGEKKDNVATMVNNRISLKVIKEEIDKCEVVCANCHALRTWSRKYENENLESKA